MQPKTRARYALKSMVEIARSSQVGQPISLERVARKTGISRRYLEQLTKGLREASLLKSVRGRSGGYQLAQPAGEIRVGQIIEAVIGPINIVDCVLMPETCLQADLCECRAVYQHINGRIADALKSISLSGLAKGGFAGNEKFIENEEIVGCPARQPPSQKASRRS